MHILIGLLTAAAGAFWAFRYFTDAAREGRDAVRDAQGLWRSQKWSRKVSQRLVESLEDPREAAAILLLQVANYDGVLTEAQREKIMAEMTGAFGVDDTTATELLAFARMAIGQVGDAGEALRKLLAPVIASCTEIERRDLVVMLNNVSVVEGPANDLQRRLIENVERRLLPG